MPDTYLRYYVRLDAKCTDGRTVAAINPLSEELWQEFRMHGDKFGMVDRLRHALHETAMKEKTSVVRLKSYVGYENVIRNTTISAETLAEWARDGEDVSGYKVGDTYEEEMPVQRFTLPLPEYAHPIDTR